MVRPATTTTTMPAGRYSCSAWTRRISLAAGRSSWRRLDRIVVWSSLRWRKSSWLRWSRLRKVDRRPRSTMADGRNSWMMDGGLRWPAAGAEAAPASGRTCTSCPADSRSPSWSKRSSSFACGRPACAAAGQVPEAPGSAAASSARSGSNLCVCARACVCVCENDGRLNISWSIEWKGSPSRRA